MRRAHVAVSRLRFGLEDNDYVTFTDEFKSTLKFGSAFQSKSYPDTKQRT